MGQVDGAILLIDEPTLCDKLRPRPHDPNNSSISTYQRYTKYKSKCAMCKIRPKNRSVTIFK